MKYLISFVILTVTFLSFSQSSVTFKGKITNPITESVFIFKNENIDGKTTKKQVATSKIENDGSFKMSFTIEELTELIFSDGNETTTFLVKPEDELFLSLNTKMFDETIEYYGKGAEKNNAIKNMALMIESVSNRFYDFPPKSDTSEIFAFIDYEFSNLINLTKDYQSIAGFESYGNRLIKELEQGKIDLRYNFYENIKLIQAFDDLVGSEGINIEGIDLEGKKVNLVDYKGKVIVIDFWAPWCAPCRAEMPAFKELEEKYGEEVNFISLGVYSDEKKWRKMATDLAFKNNIFVAKEESVQFDNWMVNYIPRYIVLDKYFKIIEADAPRPSSGKLEKLILELK